MLTLKSKFSLGLLQTSYHFQCHRHSEQKNKRKQATTKTNNKTKIIVSISPHKWIVLLSYPVSYFHCMTLCASDIFTFYVHIFRMRHLKIRSKRTILVVEWTLRQETCLNQVWFSGIADVDPWYVQIPQCGLESGEKITQFMDFFKINLYLFISHSFTSSQSFLIIIINTKFDHIMIL